MAEESKKSSPGKQSAAAKNASPQRPVAAAKKSGTPKVLKDGTPKAPRAQKSGPAKSGGAYSEGTEAARAKAAAASGSRFFKRATDRARRIADDPEKLREIADKAGRTSALRSGPFAAVLDEFRALIRLVVAYARGHYRQIPIDKLIIVVGGLIYVVSPIDVIPDAVPGLGFLDDASVIAWVLKSVREELDAFREWESGVTD